VVFFEVGLAVTRCVKNKTETMSQILLTSARRGLMDKKRKKRGYKAVVPSQDYADDESILYGVDNYEEILESCECELFAKLEELEAATDAPQIMQLAITCSELAVFPLTPEVRPATTASSAGATWFCFSKKKKKKKRRKNKKKREKRQKEGETGFGSAHLSCFLV
jgi:hypothetical protein